MSIITILVICIVIAVIFWVTGQIPQPYQTWVRVVAGILIVILLLNWIGAFDGINLNSPRRL